MLAAILSFMLAAQVAAPEDLPVAASPEAVLTQVMACGVRQGEARIRVDQTLQEAVVDIGRATRLSDAQLTCLARVSVNSSWFLVFDAVTDARYEPLYSRASKAVGLKRARAWLASHGLAARVPRYDAARDDATVTTTRIEALCGAPPGTHRAFVTATTLVEEPMVSDETLICISNVALVAGVDLGFVGNDAAAPVTPQ